MPPGAAKAVPRDVAQALEARATRRGRIGARLIYLETTSSTNDVADSLAFDGAAHGTTVVAEAQQSGRGRMGRTWFSPPGAGLYVSVVLRPEELGDRATSASLASRVSLTAGVAVAEAIRAATGLAVAIKWPNDLVVDRRKLCGILAEASSSAEAVRHVILGYGINLQPAAYPPDLVNRATSLEGELGRPVDRAAVLAESLACLADWLSDGTQASFARMLERWRALSPSSRGAEVEVVQPGGTRTTGRTAGIDTDGALLVSVGDAVERVIAGEVRWL